MAPFACSTSIHCPCTYNFQCVRYNFSCTWYNYQCTYLLWRGDMVRNMTRDWRGSRFKSTHFAHVRSPLWYATIRFMFWATWFPSISRSHLKMSIGSRGCTVQIFNASTTCFFSYDVHLSEWVHQCAESKTNTSAALQYLAFSSIKSKCKILLFPSPFFNSTKSGAQQNSIEVSKSCTSNQTSFS